MSNYHVLKDKESRQWRVQKEGAASVSGFADTQREAEQIAKLLSSRSGGGKLIFFI